VCTQYVYTCTRVHYCVPNVHSVHNDAFLIIFIAKHFVAEYDWSSLGLFWMWMNTSKQFELKCFLILNSEFVQPALRYWLITAKSGLQLNAIFVSIMKEQVYTPCGPYITSATLQLRVMRGPGREDAAGEYVWLIIYAVDKEVNNKPPTWRSVNGRHYAALVPLLRLDGGAATRTILLLLVFAAKYTAVGRRRQRPGALLCSTDQTDDRRLTIQNRCTVDETLQFLQP